ncbi:MAG: hypothetical protein [Bacteriophage sp.]|nr:MAG: hypothetical protein [Bacteriophage sp.]
MSKFKVGDKVVRTVESKAFWLIQGVKNYYIVTDIGAGGYWLQLDGVRDKEDPRPWYAPNFELYQELGDDQLPPAPTAVLYYNSTTDEDNRQHMLVQPHWELEGHLSIAVVKGGKEFNPFAYGDVLSINLEPDAALQLAHDLRRMAMEIKRKEKANDI